MIIGKGQTERIGRDEQNWNKEDKNIRVETLTEKGEELSEVSEDSELVRR